MNKERRKQISKLIDDIERCSIEFEKMAPEMVGKSKRRAAKADTIKKEFANSISSLGDIY